MKLKNKYFIMRHGQAISNVKRLCSCRIEKFVNPLTPTGKKMAKQSSEKLKIICLKKGDNIDLIFHSPLLRATQTAEIAGKVLKIKPKPDLRLREIGFGSFNNKSLDLMWRFFKKEEDRIKKCLPGGETYKQILTRMLNFICAIDQKYKGKNILIVSHEGPLFLLQGKAKGLSFKETIDLYPPGRRIHKAEIRELNFL